MPVVKIFGMPRQFRDTTELNRLLTRIQSAVASVRELEIGGDHVSVFALEDLSSQELGVELIAEVCGLYDLPERTEEVLEKLRYTIAYELILFVQDKGRLSQCRNVEVYIASTVKPGQCAQYSRPEGGGPFVTQK